MVVSRLRLSAILAIRRRGGNGKVDLAGDFSLDLDPLDDLDRRLVLPAGDERGFRIARVADSLPAREPADDLVVAFGDIVESEAAAGICPRVVGMIVDEQEGARPVIAGG